MLVLRADAPAEPAGVAECLGQRLEGPGDDGAGDAEAATLSAAVRLGAVLTAVDASSVVNDLVGNHVAMCDRFDDCDEPRSVGELVAEQIEQADVIVVVGTQPTDAQNVANATALCTALNPRAAIVGLEGLGVWGGAEERGPACPQVDQRAHPLGRPLVQPRRWSTKSTTNG